MRRILSFNTRIGPFFIVQDRDRFHAVWNDEFLGAYSRPEHAIDDLAGGHTFSLSNRVDTATLGIPEDIGEWHRVSK